MREKVGRVLCDKCTKYFDSIVALLHHQTSRCKYRKVKSSESIPKLGCDDSRSEKMKRIHEKRQCMMLNAVSNESVLNENLRDDDRQYTEMCKCVNQYSCT